MFEGIYVYVLCVGVSRWACLCIYVYVLKYERFCLRARVDRVIFFKGLSVSDRVGLRAFVGRR